MKSTKVSAFCPGHISGYFKRIIGKTMATTGSIGAGIVISDGVTVTVSQSDVTSVCILRRDADGTHNTIAYSSPLLISVIDRLDVTASVVTECRLPIGSGFGLSAAALLAMLTALDRLYRLGLTNHEIALLAHEAEVVHRTGLGDVAACQNGGRVIRTGPGIDAEIVRKYDLAEPLYAVSFGPIHTPSVLGSHEQMERVTSAFPDMVPDDLKSFFYHSHQFATKSGLITPQVRGVLRICDDGRVPASMTMLGNGVFAYGHKARDLLRPFGEVYEFRMAHTGARIIEETQ